MKRHLLFIIGLTMSMVAQAQSDSLKAAYRQVCTTLKEYKFLSQDLVDGRYDHSTSVTSIALKVQQGIFIFTITDKLCKFSDPAFGFEHRTKTIKVPVSEVRFNIASYPHEINIVGENGVELNYKGKKELLRAYEIHGEELTLRKLHKELTRLQDILKTENYTGSLGMGGATSKKTTSKSTPKQKTETAVPTQQRQRKHVPAGN